MLPRSCFFLSSNFFVKATLRNWTKKKTVEWLPLLFFFCFLSSKASVRHSKVRFSFLKVFFCSSKTHGVRQALLVNIVPWPFVSSFFVVSANLFGKNSLPTTTVPSFSSIPKRYLFAPNHFFYRYQKRYQNQRNQVFLPYQNDIFLLQTTFFIDTKNDTKTSVTKFFFDTKTIPFCSKPLFCSLPKKAKTIPYQRFFFFATNQLWTLWLRRRSPKFWMAFCGFGYHTCIVLFFWSWHFF